MLIVFALALFPFLPGVTRPARASELTAKNQDSTVNIDGRLQMLAVLESLDNHGWKDDQRLLLFLKQARLNLNGVYNNCDYSLQLMFGGEELPKANSVMSLLDAYVNVPFVEDLFEVKAGQFRVPYGRERLYDSGAMVNTERSIQNNFFNIGRDVGLAAHTKAGIFSGALGVFTGGGINVPQRYIPEDLGVPMLITRLGVNKDLDKDVFTPYQNSDEASTGVKYAAYVNGAYTEDSRVGHSTPLNVKYFDKSLMLNANWNPYIGAANQKAIFSQVGVDAAVEIPLSEKTDLRLSAEANIANFKNDAGSLEAIGGVIGANLMMKNWELGLRYAVVSPDSKFAYTRTDTETGEKTLFPITDKNISEITPSVVYYARKFGAKFIADLAIQLDVPMGIEKDHGLYNLMLQPDSVSNIAKGGKELQDVYVARLIAQYDF